LLTTLKDKDFEWYEVIRQAINEASIAPIVILTRGELGVYELDEDEMIGDYPDSEPIKEKMCENEHCKAENCTCDPCECTEEECCDCD